MEIITDSLEGAFASLSRYNVLASLPSTDLWGIQLRLSESISWTGSQWLSCSGNSPTGHAALVKLNTGHLMYYCSLIALILRVALLPHDTVNASQEQGVIRPSGVSIMTGRWLVHFDVSVVWAIGAFMSEHLGFMHQLAHNKDVRKSLVARYEVCRKRGAGRSAREESAVVTALPQMTTSA